MTKMSRFGSDISTAGKVAALVDADLDDARDVLMESKAIKGLGEIRDYQVGPAFTIEEAVTVAHPEHGDRVLTEPGCYQVVYQRALDTDERETREMD